MSQQAASDFIRRLSTDTTLSQEATTALAGATDGSQFLPLLAAFAARYGFDVTAEELQPHVPAASDTGLTDEDLSRVARGFGHAEPYR